MNTKLLLVILFTGNIFLQSCKKDNTPTPGSPSSAKIPNTVLFNWEFNGSTWVRNGFMLLDLNHDNNKDKAYIIIEPQQTGTDAFRFVLKEGPKPIDSLASNWPADVKSASFGYSNDMTVNAAMRLQAQTASRPYTYRYDSIHKFSTAIYIYNYLNNPLYAGSMAGKNPQGRTSAWAPDASGNAIPRDIIFYFKESAFSDVIGPGRGGIYLTDLVNGFNTPSEMWKKVDAVMTMQGSIYTHLYFDFDEWQFFSVYDWCPASYGAECLKGGVQIIKWQSMNNLMTWPEGWGKK